MPKTPLDLKGKTFGNLYVIKDIGRNSHGARLWLCRCNLCGSKTVIEASRFKEGKTDCGCTYKNKRADLTGHTYGALTVLKYVGPDDSGNRMYLCRCNNCGSEKNFPACTIWSKPKGCGCKQYSIEQMTKMSKAGVEAQNINGANISAVFKKEATAMSKTGVRGVFPESGRNTYRATCQVGGELWIRTGFTSIEAAKKARDEMHEQLVKKHGLENYYKLEQNKSGNTKG